MPPAKSELTRDGFLRIRWGYELQTRLERLALFYGVPYTDLTGAILETHAASQEKNLSLAIGASSEVPNVKYNKVAALPAPSQLLYEFLTLKLNLLHRAATAEARENVAQFTFKQWMGGEVPLEAAIQKP